MSKINEPAGVQQNVGPSTKKETEVRTQSQGLTKLRGLPVVIIRVYFVDRSPQPFCQGEVVDLTLTLQPYWNARTTTLTRSEKKKQRAPAAGDKVTNLGQLHVPTNKKVKKKNTHNTRKSARPLAL